MKPNQNLLSQFSNSQTRSLHKTSLPEANVLGRGMKKKNIGRIKLIKKCVTGLNFLLSFAH